MSLEWQAHQEQSHRHCLLQLWCSQAEHTVWANVGSFSHPCCKKCLSLPRKLWKERRRMSDVSGRSQRGASGSLVEERSNTGICITLAEMKELILPHTRVGNVLTGQFLNRFGDFVLFVPIRFLISAAGNTQVLMNLLFGLLLWWLFILSIMQCTEWRQNFSKWWIPQYSTLWRVKSNLFWLFCNQHRPHALLSHNL